MQKMADIIISVLAMAVGAVIGIGGVVLLLYLFSD
jgi:hypothetical protein